MNEIIDNNLDSIFTIGEALIALSAAFDDYGQKECADLIKSYGYKLKKICGFIVEEMDVQEGDKA